MVAMAPKHPKDFKIPDDSQERETPVVKFRYRPRSRTASNRTALLIGGAALVVILILLLKLF